MRGCRLNRDDHGPWSLGDPPLSSTHTFGGPVVRVVRAAVLVQMLMVRLGCRRER